MWGPFLIGLVFLEQHEETTVTSLCPCMHREETLKKHKEKVICH